MSKSTGAQAKRKGPRPKHVPLRTCVVCHEKDAKRQFVRIVRTSEDGVQIDPTGKRNGRGAYLCARFSCWERAAAGNSLDRALKTEVDPDVRQRLLRYADEHFRRDDAAQS